MPGETMKDEHGDPFLSAERVPPPDYPRRPLRGVLVAVLKFVRNQRGLQLIRPNTRAIRQGEIHELMATDEPGAAPGGRVDRVAGIAFVEFTVGGILAEGDRVVVAGETLGHIVGFDESHMPNHQNIVLRASDRQTGLQRGLPVDAAIAFLPPAAT